MALHCTAVHILFEAFGHYYVNSEMPRIGNEKLLNGLEEGVFIIDKKENTMLFKNNAAKKLTKRMLDESGINLIDERDSVLKSNLECFAPVNENIFSRLDSDFSHEKIIKKIEQVQNFVTLDSIVQAQLEICGEDES